MRLCAAIVVVIAAARAAALAGPVTCSTSFQGYRVCSGPGGYMSTETPWRGNHARLKPEQAIPVLVNFVLEADIAERSRLAIASRRRACELDGYTQAKPAHLARES
jgi:hypothetical protein